MQHTLASAVRVSGIGLHTGKSVEVVLHPAPAGTGVVFMGPAFHRQGACVQCGGHPIGDFDR